VLLRVLACEALSVRNQEIQFAANKFGKPYLMNDPSFHFNISHTRSAFVAAVGDSPLGVDIEKMNKADPDVAGKIFTADEYAYVFSNDASKDIRFNEVWTKKESYVKWTGEGWSSDPFKIDVFSEPIAFQTATLKIRGYVVSLCSDTMNNYPEIIQIRETELLERVNNSIVHIG
jgi:4'-phosphopantetheinyl transferase